MSDTALLEKYETLSADAVIERVLAENTRTRRASLAAFRPKT